jgi:hypothetical protein
MVTEKIMDIKSRLDGLQVQLKQRGIVDVKGCLENFNVETSEVKECLAEALEEYLENGTTKIENAESFFEHLSKSK